MKCTRIVSCLLMCLLFSLLITHSTNAVEGLTLSQSSLNILVGKSKTLTAISTSVSDTVTFSTSNASIASVSIWGDRQATIIGTGIGTATITVSCSNGATAFCTVYVSEILPTPNAQNKTSWCWAAACKKVGVHNGGNALPTGKSNLTYTDGIRDGYCGRVSTTIYTADAGQRALVVHSFGDDKNRGGASDAILSGIQYASARTLSVGDQEGTAYLTNSLTSAQVTSLINELASNRWVVGGVHILNGLGGHSIVITNYNSSTQVFTFWDPWDDVYYSFTIADIQNCAINVSPALSNADYVLDSYSFGR